MHRARMRSQLRGYKMSTERPNLLKTGVICNFACDMTSGLSYFYGIAATVFVTVGLTVAAVRLFHMCRPFNRNPKYYYPGRPFVVGIYLNALILIPYIIRPESGDALYLARLYFFPVTIFHFTILLFSYFGNVMEWKKWRGPMLIMSVLLSLILISTFVMTLIPGNQIESYIPVLSKWLLFLLGIIITIICIAALAVVLIWAKRFDSDDFSNPADFPVISARRWTLLVVASMTLCWAGFLVATPVFLAIIMILLAVSALVFVISALHPHRSRPVELEDTESVETTSKRVASKKKQEEILQAIHTVVVEQEAYLDAHLTIQDVANRSGYSRSALSSLFKAYMGGFFNYVNGLRVHHVDTYMQEHPSSTLQEAVLESGFNSRQAYYSVKGKK